MSTPYPPQYPQQQYPQQQYPQASQQQYPQASQQQSFQPPYPPMQQPYPLQPAPVFQPLPPKKSRKGLAAALVLGILAFVGVVGLANSPGFKKGFEAGYSAVATPSVAASTTAKTTEASSNVTMMKLAWKSMSAADKAGIRDIWRQYKDYPTMAKLYVSTFKTTMNDAGYSFTTAEVIEFLDWTLSN